MARKTEEQFEAYMLEVIVDRKRDKWPAVLRVILKQLSKLFSTIVQFRLWLFKTGIMRPHTPGCQVISVGNLTVGGTGKTPIVEIFARSLQDSGRTVAILSRGYKKEKLPLSTRIKNKLLFKESSLPPRVVCDGKQLLLDSRLSGDEPYMLASNLRDVVVLVDKDRVKSAQYAIKHYGCDTLILDDGFQYQRLRHRLDIVLVEGLCFAL